MGSQVDEVMDEAGGSAIRNRQSMLEVAGPCGFNEWYSTVYQPAFYQGPLLPENAQ